VQLLAPLPLKVLAGQLLQPLKPALE